MSDPAGSLAYMTVADEYAVVAAGFAARLAGVGPRQLDASTPCSEWNVRDLVAHVIDVQHRMIAKVQDTSAASIELRADLSRQWRQASEAVLACLDDPARAAALVDGPVGRQTFEALIAGLVCADVTVHTWDLARATGQDERLDHAGVVNALSFLQALGDDMRGGRETFAARIEPAPGSDLQTALLNFCGRVV